MRPAAAVSEPLALTDEILRLRAWRMPDMVAYQQGPDEWWITPLDDNLPLVRLNRTGLELLTSMDGHITVGSLPSFILALSRL